ncbi:MAG: MazG family protein [Actinomycetes bacterium]
MSRGRLVLLSTSPRVAPGLLSWDAWSVVRRGRVVAADEQHPLLPYLGLAGVEVELVEGAQVARTLLARAVASDVPVVFLLHPHGEDAFTRELSALLLDGAGADALPEVEVLPGSYDLPGARLLDLVATMDRLRSPGGCPWDAEQTHESLVTYLVEETYETLEAIETGDRHHLREELGDLLLQVMFHSRIAAEDPGEPWTIDDVAGDIVDKLVRRHPHVFARQDGDAAPGAADLEATWERSKAHEKGRTSSIEGVPAGLPALALAAKLMHRAEKAGVQVVEDTGPDTLDSVGERLFALVSEARAQGLDPEAELRGRIRRYVAAVQAAETTGLAPQSAVEVEVGAEADPEE